MLIQKTLQTTNKKIKEVCLSHPAYLTILVHKVQSIKFEEFVLKSIL